MATRRSQAPLRHFDLPFSLPDFNVADAYPGREHSRRYDRQRARPSFFDALRGAAAHTYSTAAGLMILLLFATLFLSRCGATGKHRALAAALPTSTPAAEQSLLARIVAPREPVTILVLGSDQRPEDGSFRTDVVVLVTVDGQQNRVSALSFPRDLIVDIPHYGEDRINTVMEYGGFSLMQDTFEKNYGVRPQYYFMTNFSNFVDLINSIGGVDVQISQPLEDACDLNWSRGGTCAVDPGTKNMDGDTALWYIRSRHTSSDFDRLRRAQEVMMAIFKRYMQMNAILRLPELYQQYSQMVETNMKAAEILKLMPAAATVVGDPQRIQGRTVPPELTGPFTSATGAAVLLPDKEGIRQLVKEASFGQ